MLDNTETFQNKSKLINRRMFILSAAKVIVFFAIVSIIIFNIVIYHQSKKKYSFHNYLNLIKRIKKY